MPKKPPSAADVLTAAQQASGRNKTRFATDILRVNDRTFRGWVAGEACWPPVVQLCRLLAAHPELADEIDDDVRPT